MQSNLFGSYFSRLFLCTHQNLQLRSSVALTLVGLLPLSCASASCLRIRSHSDGSRSREALLM